MTAVDAKPPIATSIFDSKGMRLFLILTLTLFLAACAKHKPEDFQIDGWTKTRVLASLGKPKTDFEVTGEQFKNHVGPKPSFYESMADDEKLEVWLYVVTDNRAAAVYFDESEEVADVVMFRTDVVY